MGLAEAFDRSQNLVCGHGLASVSSRPPYFTFHLLNVALLIPCLRQTSAAFAPTSCPRNPDDLVFRAYEISKCHSHRHDVVEQCLGAMLMSLTEESGKRSRGRPLVRPEDETRHLIMTVAMAEFVAKGFSGASMNEVARRAAASKRTVYRLFPTKADLFRAVVRDTVLPLTEAMTNEIDEPSAIGPALERIMFEYGRVTLSADVIAIQKLAIAESAQFPDLAAAFYVAIDATQTALERFVRRQCDRGHLDFDDAGLAADLLRGMMIMGPTRAVMFNRRTVPEAEEIAYRANVCVRLFLDGSRAGAAS